MRRETKQLRVLRSLRRLGMILTSAKVYHLCHTFSPRVNWTILFASWTYLRPRRSYLDQDLNEWNLLQENARVTLFHTRHGQFEENFTKEDDPVFCFNVDCLMNALGIKHDPQEWRLFIDSTKLSLDAELLHIGNQLSSIPVHMKETYDNPKYLLNSVQYSRYGWHLYCDLKVYWLSWRVHSLDYTLYCCFLCELDSRARTLH